MPSADAAVGRGTDTTSPELALVDPALATRVRERLAEPSDTLARVESDIALRRLTTLAERGIASEATVRTLLRPPEHETVRARRPSKLLAAGAVAAALATALLIGVNVDLRGTPAGADSTEQQRGVTDEPAERVESQPRSAVAEEPAERVESQPRSAVADDRSTRRSSRTRPAASSRMSGAKRFAWAPVSGASGYRVEFFRGDARIYSAVTAEPQFMLPSLWTFEGRKQRLSRGAYRWYVWAVVAGLRQSEATVQAELVVPDGRS